MGGYMKEKYVSYYRVSTKKQGMSGLGLESQEQAVLNFLGDNRQLLKTFTEIESGKSNDRDELSKAIEYAKLTGSTLLIAKLDRLSRNLHFITTLQESGVKFICADMSDANTFTVHIMAALAQKEGELISERTKLALHMAKQRGVVLGKPENLTQEARIKGSKNASISIRTKADEFCIKIYKVIEPLIGNTTLDGIAKYLNNQGILTSRRKKWYPTTVKNVIDRERIIRNRGK